MSLIPNVYLSVFVSAFSISEHRVDVVEMSAFTKTSYSLVVEGGMPVRTRGRLTYGSL